MADNEPETPPKPPEPETPPKLPERLAGAVLTLEAPADLAERWDVVLAADVEGQLPRVLAGALGLCWPRLRKRVRYGGNILTYGGNVIRTLLAEGATIAEIVRVGSAAYALCRAGLVDVEGAGDFSEPPADPGGAQSGG